MRTAAKRDIAEPAIIKALRKRGHLVQPLSQPGVPDLLVGASSDLFNAVFFMADPNPRFVLLEVKSKRNKRGDLEPLSPLEVEWHKAFKDFPVYIVSTPEEAINAVEAR